MKKYLPLIVLITLLNTLTGYAQFDPPANDDCSAAFWIAEDTICTTETFTTEFATQSEAAGIWCAGIPDDDVWYRFTATSERMEIQATGIDNFDATVQLFNGNCGNLDPTPCADATGPGETETLLMEDLVIGVIYYFRVFDRLSQATQTSFLFDLCLVELEIIPLETTDIPCVAIQTENLVPVDDTVRFYNNELNTVLDNEALITPPSGICDNYDYSGWCSDDPIQNSAWFAFEVPPSGSVAINLCNGGLGTEILTQLALYSFTDCNNFSSFTFIAGNEVSPDCAMGSQLSACDLNPGETYMVMVDGYQAASGTFGASLNEILPPAAGIGSDVDICKKTPSYDLSDALTDANEGGFWIDVDNTGELNNGFFNAENTPAGTYNFTYVVDGFICFDNDSAFVSVTTEPLADAGNNGIASLCTNADPFPLFDYLNGTPEAGGFWRDPNGAIHSGTYDLASDPEGTYLYIIESDDIACPGDSSFAAVDVEIIGAVDAGGDGATTTCTNDLPFAMIDFLNGSPDIGGTWFDEGSNEVPDGIFDPATQSGGNYFYLVSAPGCDDDFSILTITVLMGADAGENAIHFLCFDDAPVDMFTLLGGTPDAGGTWKDPEGNDTGNMFDPATGAQGNYTYSVSAPGCNDDMAIVTILVETEADAGESSSVSVCEDDTGIDLFDELGGTPQSGGFWSDPFGEVLVDGFFVAVNNDPPGDYTYFVVKDCSFDQAIVTVTVLGAPSAGTPLPEDTVTWNANPSIDLFTLLDNPDPGGTWSDDNSSNGLNGSIFTATQGNNQNTYHFTYFIGGACGNSSATVSVFVDQLIGIKELNGIAFKIYPNPATNKITLEMLTFAGPVQAKIYDVSGRMVYTQDLLISGDQITVDFDLQAGKYILELSNNGTILGREKLIIQ